MFQRPGQKARRGIVVAILFGSLACFANWLLVGETSPLYRYFLFHVQLPNIWGRLNSLPYVAVMVVGRRGLADTLYYVFLFIQWAVLSMLISLFVPLRNQSPK